EGRRRPRPGCVRKRPTSGSDRGRPPPRFVIRRPRRDPGAARGNPQGYGFFRDAAPSELDVASRRTAGGPGDRPEFVPRVSRDRGGATRQVPPHLAGCLVAMPLDQPLLVVVPPELPQGIKQICDGGEGPAPEHVLLERADEPLGASVPLGFPHEARR